MPPTDHSSPHDPPNETTIDWSPLLETFAKHNRFTVTTHVRPDADAIGSATGVAGLLRGMGKLTRIINPGEAPKYLQWMAAGDELLKIGEDVTHAEALDTDCHIIVDTSAWAQVGDVAEVIRQTKAEKVVIDHHVSSDDMGATEYKDTKAAAAGVLIAELYIAAGVTPTPEQADGLFCAIATDTGWYRFNSVDGRTMRVAAWLINCGATPSESYKRLYERSSLARLKLQARVLDRVTIDAGGRLAYSWVLRSDVDELNAQPADTEGFVNQLLTVDGVDAAFLMNEQHDGRMKTSLRSRPPVEISPVAESFGGGGHKQASGALVDGPSEQAISKVRDALVAHLAAHPATPSV